MKQLDEERKAAVEQLKHAAYFHRQVAGCRTASRRPSYRPCRGW